MSTSSQNDSRAAAVAGLRDFADFLESNPDVREPDYQRVLLPLMSNSAVEEFAAKHDLTVGFDDEGNASCDLRFGPINYHAYGYVNFEEHCERASERQARNWAAAQGLELVKPLVSDDAARLADSPRGVAA